MSTEDKFNPSDYRGRNQITLKTTYQGIRSVYRWCDDQKKYILPKTGNKYVALVKQNGRQKEKYFERLEDAKRWRVSGEGLKQSIPKFLFEEVLAQYFAHIKSGVAPSTWKTYWNSTGHLGYFLKMPVAGITSQTIDQWLIQVKAPKYLERQHKTRFTYAKELKVLKQILKFYSEYKDETFGVPVKARHNRDAVIDAQKLKAARIKNQSRYLDTEEQNRFLTALRQVTGEDRKLYYLLACFQLMTGARIGEAAAIHWADIDMIGEKLIISKNVHWGRGVGARTFIQPFTKTGVSRRVPMTADLKLLLKDMNINAKPGLVFSFDGNSPLTYRSIQHFYNKAFERAGISHRSTHILRHTFSTDFITDTKDHISLSRLLGHSSTRQTEHYAKITGNLTDESFRAYKEGSEERIGKVLKLV
jgi:integrase